MGKENSPGVTDPVMEADLALGGLGLKVWSDTADLKSHEISVRWNADPRLRRARRGELNIVLRGTA
jgi:hypothetical protein